MDTWHSRSIPETLDALGSELREGLSASDIQHRLSTHGHNRLPVPPRAGPLRRFFRQFNNLLIFVLLAAAVLTGALGHFVDTVVILAVVIVNATIGFVQEGKAESALAAIRNLLAPRATVVRDGRRSDIPGEDVVPGDLLILEAGERVPADVRLCELRGLRVDEAALTGESVTAEKSLPAVVAEAPLADRLCMAYAGTMVTAGQARGVVVATGASTEIGRISGLIAAVNPVDTPLLRQMAVFARWLTLVIVGVSALILLAAVFFSDKPFAELFMVLVGLSVAAVPEGLPAILTVTLAIGVQSMAQRKAIVRRLPAIEALGSVSVICSDKTGTLTKNEMTVTGVYTADVEFEVSGAGYAPHGGFSVAGHDASPGDHPLLSEIGVASVLCNDADLVFADETWSVTGDPMEAALVTLAGKIGVDASKTRKECPRTDVIPFDSSHRCMASLHHDHEGRGVIYVKGAPEAIIERCTAVASGGERCDIDLGHWQELADRIATSGKRVLAIACKSRTATETELMFDDIEGELTLLGLLGLIDPPRDEAIKAVKDCRAAGIRVKMITGDHAETAAAIGRQLGLENADAVLRGTDIDALDASALRAKAAEVDVFARTTPEHKLRLVEALQATGEVVAMTGDGVNDAPALKRADIGIAMGGKGTEAAKDASEVVLADDNFATIAAAIEAGRTVYDNLRKAIIFLLPVNGGESLSLVAALLLGLTLPITPVQILWVNMVSSVLLAMTLAFERAERGIMARPPRPRDEAIISPFVLWRVAFVSLLFLAGIFGKFALARAQGASVEEARTIAVNTLIAMEIFYLFAVRYLHGGSITLRGILGTPPVLIAIAAVLSLQALFTYAPFMEAFFGTRPLSLQQLGQIALVGVAVLGILELEKLIVRGLGRLPSGGKGSAQHKDLRGTG